MTDIANYDYELPSSFVAQRPVTPRDHSKLMVLDRARGDIAERRFYEIGEFLSDGDLLVLNDTKVFPARLIGKRETGGRVEALLVREVENGRWEALLGARGRLKENERLAFEENRLVAYLREKLGGGSWVVEFEGVKELHNVLDEVGRVPLPPYIRRDDADAELSIEDRERYQTVYAQKPGAVAAPTAGFHFTDDLLREIAGKGVEICTITLHVGPGTFRPITTDNIESHEMDSEHYSITDEAAAKINRALRDERRIIAVGTTTCRTLESAYCDGEIHAGSEWTNLYIHPPYEFRTVSALITNFHLPKTTLLVLVCSFAGRELVLRAYEEAKQLGLRFYSYGDAMLIV